MIRRTPLPHGLLTIRVSTRLGWHQRTMLPLFSVELETQLRNLGAAERARIGLGRAFTVEALAADSPSWQRLSWAPGSHHPDIDEREAVDPPFDCCEYFPACTC